MSAGNPQPIGYVGTNITFGAAVALDFVAPADRRFFWVKNASGVSTTVAVSVPGTTFEQANPDVGVTVPAGQERMIGPLNEGLGDPGALGLVLVSISPTTSVTVAAVDVPTPPPDLP